MNSIENWLLRDSIGKDLFLQERRFLQAALSHLPKKKLSAMSLGSVNIFQHITYEFLNTYQLSNELPCEVVVDFENLPISDECIDVVICCHGIELFKNKTKVIKEISRILTPEGHFIICTFNPHRFWFFNPKWQGVPIIKKKDCIAPKQLVEYLKLNELEVKTGKFLFYTPLMNSFLISNQIPFLEKAGNRWWPNFSFVYALVARKKVLQLMNQPLIEKILGHRDSCLVPLVWSDRPVKFTERK